MVEETFETFQRIINEIVNGVGFEEDDDINEDYLEDNTNENYLSGDPISNVEYPDPDEDLIISIIVDNYLLSIKNTHIPLKKEIIDYVFSNFLKENLDSDCKTLRAIDLIYFMCKDSEEITSYLERYLFDFLHIATSGSSSDSSFIRFIAIKCIIRILENLKSNELNFTSFEPYVDKILERVVESVTSVVSSYMFTSGELPSCIRYYFAEPPGEEIWNIDCPTCPYHRDWSYEIKDFVPHEIWDYVHIKVDDSFSDDVNHFLIDEGYVLFRILKAMMYQQILVDKIMPEIKGTLIREIDMKNYNQSQIWLIYELYNLIAAEKVDVEPDFLKIVFKHLCDLQQDYYLDENLKSDMHSILQKWKNIMPEIPDCE